MNEKPDQASAAAPRRKRRATSKSAAPAEPVAPVEAAVPAEPPVPAGTPAAAKSPDGANDRTGREPGDLALAMSPRQIIGGFALLAGLILMLRRRRGRKG